MDPQFLHHHLNENGAPIHSPDVQFNMGYILAATAFAGIFVAILIYFLLSQTRKSIPKDFASSTTMTHSHASQQLTGHNSRRANVDTTDDSHSGDTDEDSDAILNRVADEQRSKKKIGVKKAAKLAAKAERRTAREAMMREREERKREQEYLDHLRQQEEEKERIEEEKRQEIERIAKEDQAKREHEAYLEMAATFDIEEEGNDLEDDVDSEDKLNQFINYIKEQKVVLLEQLAAQFKMRTKDVVDRIQNLISSGSLVGIIDDRGKFISITNEELQSVSKFIKQRGRVTVDELVTNSNRLINLKPVAKV